MHVTKGVDDVKFYEHQCFEVSKFLQHLGYTLGSDSGWRLAGINWIAVEMQGFNRAEFKALKDVQEPLARQKAGVPTINRGPVERDWGICGARKFYFEPSLFSG